MIPDVVLELSGEEKWRAGRSSGGPLTRVYLTERFIA
jgi:hypothetical protein